MATLVVRNLGPVPRRAVPRSLREIFGDAATRWKLRRCARVGPSTRAHGRIWIHGHGTVRLGSGVVLDGAARPIELHALERGSEIVIGDSVHICGGTSIEAVLSVKVGARSRLGAFARIMDSHFHPLVGDRHQRPLAVPVVVGEDVEIGPRAILLAGAQVGSGAMVRSGAVISRGLPVPAGATASGHPAVIE
jgi:acetyltransferase-like isoleucine patch superfamily enzyme